MGPGAGQCLAAAGRRLLADPAVGGGRGAAARGRACGEFSAAVWLDRLRALYLEAMGERR